MGSKQLKWCFKLKDGLKLAEPNERLSKSYLEQAKSSLLRAEKNLCQEPRVFDLWHEFATSQKSKIFDDYQKHKFLKLRVVLEHAQNSTSGSNHSSKTSGILTFEKDLLWATVAIYYAEYYALYSFLQRIGVKCENHACSIKAISFLLGEGKTKVINEHKEKRIDAQYYIKVDQEDKVRIMFQEAKIFVSDFDELTSSLSEEDIKHHREIIIKEKE